MSLKTVVPVIPRGAREIDAGGRFEEDGMPQALALAVVHQVQEDCTGV